MYFFDGHGGLWVTCEADEPGAIAFGPRYVARPVASSEVGLVLEPSDTQLTAARRAGRLVRAQDDDGWDTLAVEEGVPERMVAILDVWLAGKL